VKSWAIAPRQRTRTGARPQVAIDAQNGPTIGITWCTNLTQKLSGELERSEKSKAKLPRRYRQ